MQCAGVCARWSPRACVRACVGWVGAAHDVRERQRVDGVLRQAFGFQALPHAGRVGFGEGAERAAAGARALAQYLVYLVVE